MSHIKSLNLIVLLLFLVTGETQAQWNNVGGEGLRIEGHSSFVKDSLIYFLGYGNNDYGDSVHKNMASWNGMEWKEILIPDSFERIIPFDCVGSGGDTLFVVAAYWTQSEPFGPARYKVFFIMDHQAHVYSDPIVNLIPKSIALYKNRIHVGGHATQAYNALIKWTGSAWEAPANTGITGKVNTLEVRNNNLFVGGRFAVQAKDAFAAVYNDVFTTTLDNGLESEVFSILSTDGQVLAGTAPVVKLNKNYAVYSLKGTTWISNAMPNFSEIVDLSSAQGMIYAAGRNKSGPSRSYVLYNDTSLLNEWKLMDSVNGRVDQVKQFKNSIYISGSFSGLDSNGSLFINIAKKPKNLVFVRGLKNPDVPLKISPSIVDDGFILSLDQELNEQLQEVQIYSRIGNKILSVFPEPYGKELWVGTSGLSPGFYLCVVKFNGSDHYSVPFIKNQ